MREIEALDAEVARRLVFAREKAFVAGVGAGSCRRHAEALGLPAG